MKIYESRTYNPQHESSIFNPQNPENFINGLNGMSQGGWDVHTILQVGDGVLVVFCKEVVVPPAPGCVCLTKDQDLNLDTCPVHGDD